jgi:hypothetical protein
MGHDGETYLKVAKVYDIIDDLIYEERKKLRAYLETQINKKIPATKNWKDNTANIVKVLIDLEVEFDASTTYKDIKDQIFMD